MRALYAFALLLPCPALADVITAESAVTAVTVYPSGAKITREITFAAPSAGQHELLVVDMPAAIDPGLLRLAPAEGVQFGAFSLRSDRLPPREDPLTPAQEAAKAEVERLEEAARLALLAVDEVQARIEAAEAQVAFLRSFTGALPDAATPESLKAMGSMIGAETLAARQAALAARADLHPLQKALSDAQEELEEARAAFDALPARDTDYTALSVAISAEAAAETTVVMTYYVNEASWRPTYDLMLTRDGGNSLTIERSVLVTQYSGEDWTDVALTLSSSRPSEQAAPSQLWPELRSIGPEPTYGDPERSSKAAAEDSQVMYEPEIPEAAAAPITAEAMMEGDTVVYRYPGAVNIATGVEDLRLALDTLTVVPEVEARAVPRLDATAFVMATFTNTTGEPLLPGVALLFREGVLVGGTNLGLVTAGAKAEIAFGALEDIRLTRDMPTRSEGETGIITTTNEREELAVLEVENLGDETWPVRMIDQVPYSEQDDLQITVTATPKPSETDVDGQRGILAWEFDLAGGEKKEVKLKHVISWPDGMILQ
ncbi:MAG: DUF4139 domain-containing protein [Tabrizicola sp.]|nr:DUF4139 domain-containing protein [Tabrizicola sp.]